MMSVMTAVPAGTAAGTGGGVATASGWIALLQEDDVAIRTVALQKLFDCVDTLWHEVAECLPDLEAISEELDLPVELKQIAAAVASRVYFHLEEPQQALRLALEAGSTYFDPMDASTSPYVERLVAAALDAYITTRKKELDGDDDVVDVVTEKKKSAAGGKDAADDDEVGLIPPDQLRAMVHRLLETSCHAGKYDHALGIALEARETDKVREILVASGPDPALLKYALQSAQTVVSSKAFRQDALRVVADCLTTQQQQQQSTTTGASATEAADAACELVLVHQLLGQAPHVAQVLVGLFNGSEAEALLGLQLCFDLMDSGDQAFVKAVAKDLMAAAPEGGGSDPAADADDTAMATGDNDQKQVLKDRWTRAERVLVGGFSAELALSFLHKHSKADRLIMENLKKALEERSSGSRSSMLHNAAVVTHSYLYAGTTNDSFLRDHLDWMKKASNWAKFSATASLGVVHAAHITEAMHLLEPYLPSDPSAPDAAPVSPEGGYAEGGSLYALGLIHGSQAGSSAEKRQETSDFLRNHLRASHASEVISHGAALGVGLTAMGSGDLTVINELKEVLDTDSAVAGEAAGIAIGMTLVGTGAGNTHCQLPASQKEEIMDVVAELKNYARETHHEKIIRGIAMGLALMNYGQEENADAAIEEMRSDRDPVMRYGAQYALALAYCGTGSNKAIRILLHTAVSDVSDDVRMAAVIGLAFVLFNTPDRVPQLVRLLLESFNPHVRYASCMAVGIALAGTGDADGIALLEPMLDDMTDYVRQGALIGTAMIYMQQSDSCNGRKIKPFREKLATIVTEKHQSSLTKMGAILSTGIIDAGGRNCSLAMGSRNGFTKMSSAVGLALWLQHWHWFPMMHMITLAMTPTYTIGLNKDFKFPKNFELQCNSKPSVFAYPKKVEEKKEEKKKRVETVALSTTAKEKARLARKRAKLGGTDAAPMDVDKDESKSKEDGDDAKGKEGSDAKSKDEVAAKKDKDGDGGDKAKGDDAMDVDKEGEPAKKPKKKREPEPTSFRVANPARITIAQSKVCEFDLAQRYRPIRPDERPLGVIILTDSTPGEEEDLGAVKSPSLEPEGELAPPEPFEWTPPPFVPQAPAAKKADDKKGDKKADDGEKKGEEKES